MASKRRIRRNACGKKKRYETYAEGFKAMHKFKKATGLTAYLNVYQCKFCGAWHLGH